jgi:hypothetical protein
METNSDADAPLPATPDDPAAEPVAAEVPASEPAPEMDAEFVDPPIGDEAAEASDELAQIIAAAGEGRLSAAQEERGTALLREALQSGRAGVARVVAALPKLPWLVGIRAVETVWPELTAGFRTQLLAGLAKDETDGARRMRMSLARALFKIEPPVALKIAVGVAKDLRDKESGAVAQKDAQMFSSVFIGRARPWVALLPLAELKPAEADLLVHVAVFIAFSLPHPPITQLAILKWVKENERLDKLQEPAQAAVLTGLGRWSVKWQNVLRKEVADLPEAFLAALKPPAAEPAEIEETPEAGTPEEVEAEVVDDAAAAGGETDATPRRERPVYISREEEARRKALLEGGSPPEAEEAVVATEAEDEEDEEDAETEDEALPAPREAREPRENREPREARQSGRHGSFNVTQALRQIESHVNSLRTELESTKAKLRKRDSEGQRAKAKPDVPVIEGEPTPEELARLNHQLGVRNTELQARIEELTQHAEDLAAASGAASDQPVADPEAQLRTLLALKLQEDYADFRALEQEGNDIVVQQHYRTLITHIFEVLVAQGVPFKTE